jgi:hypothetical protein
MLCLFLRVYSLCDHTKTTQLEIQPTEQFPAPNFSCNNTAALFCSTKNNQTLSLLIGSSNAKHRDRQTFVLFYVLFHMSRDSSVGVATGYWLDGREAGVRIPVGSRLFSSPRRPHRLWSPHSLLSNAYRGQTGRGVTLSTHLQLVPTSIKRTSIHQLPHAPS